MEERRMVIIELPPGIAKGFRFHPTDEELITDYLRPKVLGRDSDVDKVIAEVDFCKFEPWDLPPQSKIESKDRMWLFFCKRDYKYPSSKRSKRTTKEGFWKITGKERMIKDQETKKCIGKKRTLVFHKGPTPGQRTNWVMHEYYIEPHNLLPNQRSYVLCRLKEKANDKANTPDSGEGNPCGDMSEVENPVTPAAIPSAAHGNEVNQESFSQSLQSPVFTNEEISLPSPVGSSRDRNGMQAPYGAGEPEEPPEEIVDRLIADSDVDPYPKYYWEASYNPFNDRIAQASSWSPYYVDGLVRCDTNTEGVNEQMPDLTCCLESKTDENSSTLGCNIGEPSIEIRAEIENPFAHAAISEVPGHGEGNAKVLSQPVLSPDDYLTAEDIRSIFLDGFNGGQKIDWVMHEHHPELDNNLPQQMPDLTCCLESKTDENSGTLGCNIGEPRIEIRAEIENPVAHAAISEVPGHGEGNAKVLTQPVLSTDDYLTAEDIRSIFSDGFNGGQKINSVMHEHHPELDNNLPQQWPYLTCCLENRTDEYVGSLDCNIGRPSSDITSVIENQVAPTAIPVVHGDTEVNVKLLSQTFLTPDHYATEKDISLILSNSLSDDHHNEWHALCGAAEPETSPAEFLDQRKADPYESYYEESETTNDLFNNFIQPKSLKRPHFPDIPASNDTNAGGVDGRVKRPRSLALGE